jgi:hypothetical protein
MQASSAKLGNAIQSITISTQLCEDILLVSLN